MTQFLHDYVERHLSTLVDGVTPDIPLFWSSWGQRRQQDPPPDYGQESLAALQDLRPDHRLPELKPHDLRHGVAMEILEQQHDLEAVRAMLGHVRIDTTQTYAQIKPAQLNRAVEFYEGQALDILSR